MKIFFLMVLIATNSFAAEIPDEQLYGLNFDCKIEAYRAGPTDFALTKVVTKSFEGKSNPWEGYNGKNTQLVLDGQEFSLNFALNPRGFVFFGDDIDASEGAHFELLNKGTKVAGSDLSTTEESGLPKAFTLRDGFKVGDASFVVRVQCKTSKFQKN